MWLLKNGTPAWTDLTCQPPGVDGGQLVGWVVEDADGKHAYLFDEGGLASVLFTPAQGGPQQCLAGPSSFTATTCSSFLDDLVCRASDGG